MKHTSRFALAAVAAAVLAMNAATAAELTGTLKKIQETGSPLRSAAKLPNPLRRNSAWPSSM